MTNELAKTPLHAWHVSHGGRMVDFAGWEMPVQYTSIVAEHQATRTAVGLFDVSHMGRFHFAGAGAGEFLDRLLTRRVGDMPLGKIRYSLVTNEQGGILDDVLVYRLQKPDGEPFYGLVVNASNRPKIAAWIQSHSSEFDEVSFSDRTTETAMIAVQGPRGIDVAQPLVSVRIADLDYYTGVVTSIAETTGLVSRTGYTGEDGCELVVPADHAAAIWERLIAAAADFGGRAAGLGARDTLRLEAAMPLYGHELSESINPVQAGLGFAVNLKDRRFVGRDAIAKLKSAANQPVRIGLELDGRRVPREHYPILSGDDVVGEVTSGTFSPTLEKGIAMGYVRADVSSVGTKLAIDIRGRREPAVVVKLPFYNRTR